MQVAEEAREGQRLDHAVCADRANRVLEHGERGAFDRGARHIDGKHDARFVFGRGFAIVTIPGIFRDA